MWTLCVSVTVPMGTDGVRLRQHARTCPDGEERQSTARPAACPAGGRPGLTGA